MRIAFCYEHVLPARGGCGTYIPDLARRLHADGHEVHLFACTWDEAAIGPGVQCHRLPTPRGPRFLRPWHFSSSCAVALRHCDHDVSVGFDKTWGQDVLYPQGGLHVASVEHNLRKFSSPIAATLARLGKALDLAHWSFARLERRQYLTPPRPLVIVNSEFVRKHFQHYYGVGPDEVQVVYSSIDPKRFADKDRPRRRLERRSRWGIGPEETVALFAAINYRLKGLGPLLHAVKALCDRPEYWGARHPFRLLVVGHPRFDGYERLARRLGITERVRFAGHCPDMRDGYFASDFLVHPTFYDPCSLVVLEALGCGLPVITTRYNGASELLRPLQEGYIVEDPHDRAHLAWCLAQLLDPDRRASCSHAARQTAARWTFELHYQQMLQVFFKARERKRAA
jgi:UDP-glucose:(heptosyl)LPS alpha-1,3-glucosyltransferase